MTERKRGAEAGTTKQESNNPRHWVGPRWLGIYRNPDDPHLFVRRCHPLIGLGLNHAHPLARLIIVGLIALAIVGLLLATTFGRHF